jgi:phage terminase large subunit-like protein
MTKEKSQIEKFREAARELKTDQSDAAFDAVVTKIAHARKLTPEQIKEFVRREREETKR